MSANTTKTEASAPIRPSDMATMGLPIAVGTAAFQAWAEIGTEAVRFVWERLHQDLKTQQAMLACTSLEEMRKIQADFFAAARDQYTVEAVKILSLIGKAELSGLTVPTLCRRYDDVPL